jgi:hypothetical protein
MDLDLADFHLPSAIDDALLLMRGERHVAASPWSATSMSASARSAPISAR